MVESKKQFKFFVKGHTNILSQHRTTWQITKETHLTPKGDCIVGVSSEFGAVDLPDWLKSHLQNKGKITFTLRIDTIEIKGTAEGHPDLTFTDNIDMVFRKSSFISPRTVAINSSIIASDIPVSMTSMLQDPSTIMEIVITKV